MADSVSVKELTAALDELTPAWKIAQEEADALPPYLGDDELTLDRYFERNKETLSRDDARNILDGLVSAGKLEKQYRRRRGHAGGRVVAYVVKVNQAAMPK